MKSDIYLSVRNKSTRYPGKVLKEIKGKTITDHLIQRLKTTRKASQVIVCTSTNPNDDILVEIARKNHVEYFRGSEDDKLDRYLNASKKFNTDLIIVVDGDDVFCDPLFIDECIERFQRTNADYITINNAPLGSSPFCVNPRALEKVCNIKKEKDTEVWGAYFTQSGMFKTSFIEIDTKLNRPDIRLTLDYKEDFMLIEKIFDALYIEGKIFYITDIVDWLNKNPKLLKINQNVKELYLKNLQKSPKASLNHDLN